MTDLFTEVITEDDLRNRIEQLGEKLTTDYEDRVPVFVGVLAGSLPFLADLVRQIKIELEIDFLALSRFGEGGRVRIALDTVVALTGRDVVIVEDVVDTGLTLTALRRLIETRSPSSLATVTLVDKVSRRIVDVPLEYRGFEVGDEYLLGYGFDWEGRYRNVKSVWAVLDLGVFADDPARFGQLVYPEAGDRVIA